MIGLIGGLVLGILAGAFGGWRRLLVMRIVDVMLSIPSLLLAFIDRRAGRQPSQWTVIIAIAVVRSRSSPGCCAARCSRSGPATTCSPRARSA